MPPRKRRRRARRTARRRVERAKASPARGAAKARAPAAPATGRCQRLVSLAAFGIAAAVLIPATILVLGPRLRSAGGERANPGDYPAGSVPAPGRFASKSAAAARAAGCSLRGPAIEGDGHTGDEVAYRTNPPSSGDHQFAAAEDGAYVEAPRTEGLVHSLEHGRIVIWFESSAPPPVRGDLKALFDEDDEHLILTPNETGMPFAVAASAWGRLLGCPETNGRVFDAVRAFRDRYRDQGPERAP